MGGPQVEGGDFKQAITGGGEVICHLKKPTVTKAYTQNIPGYSRTTFNDLAGDKQPQVT